MKYTWHCHSPLGDITLAGDGTSLTGLWFDGQRYYGAGLEAAPVEKRLPVFAQTEKWLEIYFSGSKPDFTPPLVLTGTPFRTAVWELLLHIPYGHTMRYGEIAAALAEKDIASAASARAVGGAVSHNPISLIVPCHRVTGAGGALTGYAGGIERKRRLLRMEMRSS